MYSIMFTCFAKSQATDRNALRTKTLYLVIVTLVGDIATSIKKKKTIKNVHSPQETV